MKIPSYDDLTPSITDVHPRDTFNDAARIIPKTDEPVVIRATYDVPRATCDVRRATYDVPRATVPLFACVRLETAPPGALMSLARDFSPRIERYGDACVVLDVAGLGRLLGDAHGIAAELGRTAAERGFHPAIAVAPTQTAARVLARAICATGDAHVAHGTSHVARGTSHVAHGPSHVARGTSHVAHGTSHVAHGTSHVVGGSVADALAPLPLSVLAADAATVAEDEVLFETLRRWGLRTIGEFAALPCDEMAARFGQRAIVWQRLAFGFDPRPLVPDPGIPRFMESLELEWPIEELEPLSFVFARLLEPLSLALERAGRGAVAIRLDLRLVDRTMYTRLLQLPAPLRDPRVLRTLLLLDLESHPPSAGIDVVTIEVDPAPGRILQFSLLEPSIPSPETLATLNARLTALVGDDQCGSPVLLDTHRPDAFELRRFEPIGRRRRSANTSSGELAEPPAGMLRRFRPPVAVRVTVERGRPVRVAIDRKRMPGGPIVHAAGPWRSSGDWWTADGTRWNRDEWDVEFADGTICCLFIDRDTAVWFLDAVVD